MTDRDHSYIRKRARYAYPLQGGLFLAAQITVLLLWAVWRVPPVYTEAVRCRLRSFRPIGTTLSGGLDSSSVTALAAKQSPSQPLHAFTAVPRHDTKDAVVTEQFGDESAFAKQVVAQHPNILHHQISAENMTPVGGIKQMLAVQGAAGHASSNYYWLLALLMAVQHQKVGTLLTGQGGNGTVSWDGLPRLAERVRASGWRRTLYHQLWAMWRQFSPWSKRPQIDWQQTAIAPAFAHKVALSERYAQQQSRRSGPIAMRQRIILPGRSVLGDRWALLGNAFGIEIRDPTYDKRVIEYTFSIPDKHFRSIRDDRHVIRHALIGVLPEGVRTNRKRGRQSADLAYRLRDSSDEVMATLAKLKRSHCTQYIDLNKLQNVFQTGVNTVTPQHTNKLVHTLMRGIDAGLYLYEG